MPEFRRLYQMVGLIFTSHSSIKRSLWSDIFAVAWSWSILRCECCRSARFLVLEASYHVGDLRSVNRISGFVLIVVLFLCCWWLCPEDLLFVTDSALSESEVWTLQSWLVPIVSWLTKLTDIRPQMLSCFKSSQIPCDLAGGVRIFATWLEDVVCALAWRGGSRFLTEILDLLVLQLLSFLTHLRQVTSFVE